MRTILAARKIFNAAVMRAHEQGVLTSTSLMVSAGAATEAIALARKMPSLAVGLHLVMVCGKSCLPHKFIPHLVDGRDRFPDSGLLAGLRLISNSSVRRELKMELRAQFDAFQESGLPFSHVDSHLHMHMHPLIFGWVCELAHEYGASGLRIPQDDLRLSISYETRGFLRKSVWYIIYRLLAASARRRVTRPPLLTARRVYGLLQSGHMDEMYTMKLLQSLRHSLVEIYFHPSLTESTDELGPNPQDFQSLTSPAVRALIQERNYRLVNYRDLKAVMYHDNYCSRSG